ncbi:hypothetical protein BDV95DRAFT_579620 [Massariosphaeria phaeospora]|uniref:Uncharacterized protein n=1 Tax=Massariosphaeria phaeospora TaxID=100035 RepID=A0A7C8I1H4_9PLEO|nr:hypothetical protein BDV95DRAFT_579620 [Massariosphaeria phaeospora]
MYNSFAGVGYWASVVSQAQAPVYIPIPKVFATPVDPEANAALEKARFSVELCAQRVAQDALLDGAGSSTATLALPKPKDNTPLSEYCAAMIIMDRKLNEFPHLSAFMQSQPAQTISRLQRYTAERAQIHKDYSFKIVQDVASFQSPLELDTLFEKKRDAYRKLREKRADELAPPGQGVELAWTSYLLDWKEEQFKMWEEQLKAEAEEDSDDGLTYAETLRSIRKESREASREVASRAAAALDEEKTLRRRATVEDLDSWAEILKKGLQAEKERQRSSSGTRDGPRRVRRSREGTDDGEGT